MLRTKFVIDFLPNTGDTLGIEAQEVQLKKPHTDMQGKPYLTAAEAKPGMRVKCDGDFTCMSKGTQTVIRADRHGSLWIKCREERHLLDGQLSDDGAAYIGLYRVVA